MTRRQCIVVRTAVMGPAVSTMTTTTTTSATVRTVDIEE